jgi:hypothetical protein
MLKKLKKYKEYSLPEILLLVAILAIITGTMVYAFKANSNTNKIYDAVAKSDANPGNTLQIESDPAGIKVSSEKYCVSDKLKKLTPFTCSIPRDQSSIVIIAPTTTTLNGAKYTFKGWTGCSKLQDPYSCKVTLPTKGPIKANYSSSPVAKNTPPPEPPITNPQPICNGTVVNNGKSCRFVINYDSTRLPGRLTASILKPSNLIAFTAECSASDACITYAQNPQPITAPYTSTAGIDFSINKPTDIIIDLPMSQNYGSNSVYLLNAFTYAKATYANGGGGTFYDTLGANYTFAYKL